MIEQNSKATKYAEYLRKSTDDKEKQVLSLGNQRDVLARLKKHHNLTIVETVEEKMSAKKPGRPGFASIVKQLKAGKIDAIVTWAPHRLSRNSVDIGELINLFDTGHLKEIVTESHTFRNNPMDIFMLGFHCLQAKFENDNKAIDVSNGMRKCAGLGIYPGCPPLGYLPDKNGIKGARKRDIDPVNFPIIRAMWDLMLAGTYTPYQIIDKATEEWGLRTRYGKKPAKCIIYTIFHNPFYYGDFEFPKKSGNWFKGNHQPMITKAEFDRVQKMMRRPDSPRPITNYFPYGGCTLHCGECGCAITGMAKTKKLQNGNLQHYVYYGCTKRRGACTQMPVTEKEITNDIEEVLRQIRIPAEIHSYLMQCTREEHEKQFGTINTQHEANKAAYETTRKKLGALINMRTSELITDDEFQEQRAEIEKERSRLVELIDANEHNVATWPEIANKLFSFMERAADKFKNGSAELQRGILLSLGWNLKITDKKLDLQGENWIEPVKRIAKYINGKLPTLEPVLSIYHKDEIKNLLDSRLLCSLIEDVRNCFAKSTDKIWFPIVDTLLHEELPLVKIQKSFN